MIDVSVVVPARDAAHLIEPLLRSLMGQRFEGEHEVIIVDNGSRDATADLAEASGMRVLRRPRGAGPGVARNDGAAVARGRILAFTDADCRPTSGWLRAGELAGRAADVVQGAVEPPPGASIGPYDRTLSVREDYGLYPTANLFVSRECFERLGGFEDWAPASDHPRGRPFGEDTWLVWRARRAGAVVAFAPRALVHHAVLPGDARAYVTELSRVGEFAALVERIPELREAFCYRRWFHSPRSAAFDLAAVGLLAGLVTRRPAALTAAAPYARLLAADARRWGRRRAAGIAATRLAADAVAAIALARGSLEARTLLL
ncbi:MAG: glycosyltransferase family 2 protein [Actinomycetota bacterium]|nr:glycosyltransferase family 2 protein [Actinomycetota bacterium]